MADAPDMLVLNKHRDLRGRENDIWVRRALMALIAVLPILALLNLFGQRPESSTASASAASLKVYTADRLRGGLLYEARFHITAKKELEKATLVLGSGWLEGMTLNTIEPSPVGEASRNGDLSLELGHIAEGDSYLLFIQFQVNPTNVGHRDRTVALYDGDTKLLDLNRPVTIFP